MNHEIFCQNSKSSKAKLREVIREQQYITYKCDICHNEGTHLGRPLSLQLDHINGISNDNRLENLRWLCPNCHTQTDNYAGKGRRKANKQYITEQLIVDTVKTVDNINQLLVKIGASNTNANYKKVKRVMEKHNLEFDSVLVVIDKQNVRRRKVKRPDKETLSAEIQMTPMTRIGEKYGVSDNAIRKWCKYYNIPIPKFGRGHWT